MPRRGHNNWCTKLTVYDWPSDKEDIMHLGWFSLPTSKTLELFFFYFKQLRFIRYSLDLLLHLLIKRWRATNQTFLHQECYIADGFTPNPMVILFFFDSLTVDF